KLIKQETSFSDLISQNVQRALAVTAVSQEKFFEPFADRFTDNDYACFNSKGQKKSCTMMKHFGEANATVVSNDVFQGARLKYEGGGSLLVFMANPNTDKSIEDFSASQLANALTKFPKGDSDGVVYLPKGVWNTPKASLKNKVLELLPEA